MIDDSKLEPDLELDAQTLSGRAVKGAAYLTARKFLLQGLGYLGSIILARLLTPEIFGIFAIVNFVITFFSSFAQAGLGPALIQKKGRLSEKELKTVFTLQQVLALGLMVIIFLVSPLLVRHYGMAKDKVWLLRAFSLSLFLSSLKIIPLILLERRLKFNRVIIPEVVEVVVYQALAVFLAYSGFEVWSFVIALLVRTLLGVVVLYLLSPWRPGFHWDWSKMKEFLKFGIPYQANGFIAMIKDAVMPVFVGSVAGAAAVGYLNWAYTFSKLPLLFMSDIFRVIFPGFARIQDNPRLLKKALEKTLKYTNMFLFPAVFLLAATAPQIVEVVFTNKWRPGLPAFYIHSLGVLMVGVANTFMNTFWACGKVKIATRLMIFYALVNWLASVPLVYRFGFNGAMVGSVVVILLSLPLNTYFVKKITPVAVWQNVWPAFLAGLLAGGITFFLARRVVAGLVSLLLVLLAGGLVYLGLLFVFEGKKLVAEASWLMAKLGIKVDFQRVKSEKSKCQS